MPSQKNKVHLLLILILLAISSKIVAQKDTLLLKPVLHFLEDSIRIGKPTPVALTYHYPKEWQVVFCDTLWEYRPFELDRKQFFPTQTSRQISRDSAIYWLRSFEIDKIQTLRLPVFLITSKGDSLMVQSNTDTIFYKEFIKSGSLETLTLRSDTKPIFLQATLDYHFWVLSSSSLVCFMVIVWLFFGNWIQKQILILNLKRKHLIFEDFFDKEIIKIRSRKRIKDIELTLQTWKLHLEIIENKPFSSYTSKEVLEVLPLGKLAESLQNIDRAIYGGVVDTHLDKDLLYLKALANRRFFRKKKVIRET